MLLLLINYCIRNMKGYVITKINRSKPGLYFMVILTEIAQT